MAYRGSDEREIKENLKIAVSPLSLGNLLSTITGYLNDFLHKSRLKAFKSFRNLKKMI